MDTEKITKSDKVNRWKIWGVVLLAVAATALMAGVILLHPWDGDGDAVIAPSNEFISLGSLNGKIDEIGKLDAYVFKDYEDYLEKTEGKGGLTTSDFEKNGYAMVILKNSYCSGEVAPVNLEMKGGQINVEVWRKTTCGACAMSYDGFMFKIDKTVRNPQIDINEKVVSHSDCNDGMDAKPMIYLYPEEETEVSVRLGEPEKLTTTYPKYENGWQVVAEPDGTLRDLRAEASREFYGLYWEGAAKNAEVHEDGFVVAGKEVAEFLEEKLAVLGLTEREANEFIVYWLPKMERNPYNYIRFETTEEINEYMPLEIVPEPNSIVRVSMAFKPLEAPIEVTEQALQTPVRTGFTVVEWGGTEIGEIGEK